MKKESQNFITLGYYICPIVNTPKYLNGISKKLISVSGCLCDHQPQLGLCAGWKPYGDNEDYRKRYNLSLDEYQMMSTKIGRLFDEKLYSDGRFIRKKDAISIYKAYFDFPEIILICLKIDKENIDKLNADFTYIQEEDDAISISQEMIGYDIIGWDIGGFHSFLCNSLHKDFNNIKFTSLGLLEMDYEEVEAMAQAIQGKGEPVDWIPCKLEEVKLINPFI